MARRGSSKVRTGCFTCKIRKVKCDETRPNCRRCSGTGRKCDGYPPKRQGEYSWPELLDSKPTTLGLTNGTSSEEARGLDFFRRVVAPAFSGHSSSYFWTQLVAQIGQQEPAVHHAVVAISSMYEQMSITHHSSLESPRARFAIGQYNLALKELSSHVKDESTVVLVCILFMCIETLQENKQAAIAHCRHGITILNRCNGGSAWVRAHLLPIFTRLSIFPFFFGASVENFPSLGDLASDIPKSFTTLDESCFALDSLVSRSIRLIRSVDSYRLKVTNAAFIPASLYEEQSSVDSSLEAWQERFSSFRLKNPPSHDLVGSYLILEMKYLVSKIWLKSSFECSEMVYDRHLDKFQQLVNLAQQILPWETKRSKVTSKPKFVFEMGYLPLLYFAVIKCRDLRIRLIALYSMKAICVHRESLWDADLLYVLGRRVIEIEHGINLETTSFEGSPDLESQLPLDEMRIRDSVVTNDIRIRQDERGQSVSLRKVCFLVWSPGDGVDLMDEWVAIDPGCPLDLIYEETNAAPWAYLSRMISPSPT
ncbi:hypothetical protein BP6252_07319 [Coleophoma cylindrospora]|uniref:Zn(2)-C6 fungal-type domain-containing protein n=1 Tax=Coleophoma cylindrospora TaxID=1849047 RepID=A0A3D8RH81_9HELO|nr:hypothetical protein BP6252_07319 [Coleophoma cylindrospora]